MTQLISEEQQAKIEADARQIAETATTLVVKTQEDYEKGAEMLSIVQNRIKRVDAIRSDIVKPLNEGLKNARDLFKTLAAPYENAKQYLKGTMGEFVQEEMDRKRKEADEAQKAKPDEIAIVEVQKTTVRSEATGATVHKRTKKEYRIIDESKLPREYLTPDTGKIRQAMLADIEIPGVEVREVPVIVSR